MVNAANSKVTQFDQALTDQHLVAMWRVLRGMLPPEPKPSAQPYKWSHSGWHPALLTAGELVTAEQAERRVLLLENPAFAGEMRIAATLHAGLQMLLPGESAQPHRHSQAALRFVLEGDGAVTSINGEAQIMRRGDLVLTPAFSWHEHHNPSPQPMVWLDGLDLPMARLLGCTFAQFSPSHPDPFNGSTTATATAAFGAALMPEQSVDHAKPVGALSYPYTAALTALEKLASSSPMDPIHGFRLHYAHPITRGHIMPTLAAYLQKLPADFRGHRYQSTESFVYCALEGSGVTRVTHADGSDQSIAWQPGDLFVIPGWLAHHHESRRESVLFAFSDAASQQNLGLWRERKI